jgi:WhiB family transcriptional regulator, redox-sensing transcriptional regulator
MMAGETDWMRMASCLNHPHRRYWFGEFAAETAIAVAVCRACPVRAECLTHAVHAAELLGVWGGTTERERGRMIRSYQRQTRQAGAA